MNLLEMMRIGRHFAQARWRPNFTDRAALQVWQAGKIDCFLREQLPRTAFYRDFAGCKLAELPVVDKNIMLANFNRMNTAGITLEKATSVALASEVSRDFAPSVGGISVGLSSGTQGPRGVFLTSSAERFKWAGIMLARALPAGMVRALLPGTVPLKIAFFLRANNNLYTTLRSRRIDLNFYDLIHGLPAHLRQLEQLDPDILVAPAHVLSALAASALSGSLKLSPRHVISVAEVLEPDDRERVERGFGRMVHQLYQCTEGFLGYTCEYGVLHLNEEYVHIEPEWLDKGRTRFTPLVTDFSRTTQHVIRYRLNDILRVRETPCRCGRASLALAAVEGRSDEVLWFAHTAPGGLVPIFPDMLRHAIATASQSIPDYRVEQHGAELRIAVAGDYASSWQALASAIGVLIQRHELRGTTFSAIPFVEGDLQSKRRRIRCVRRPEGQLLHA